MPKSVVIDELHLTVSIPAKLPDAEAEAIRVTLTGRPFLSRMRRAVRAVIKDFPQLVRVRVTWSR